MEAVLSAFIDCFAIKILPVTALFRFYSLLRLFTESDLCFGYSIEGLVCLIWAIAED